MAQQERARKTRAALVEAAAFEFSKRGYAAASVNTILEGSRATKGAMYFHFSSKEELARAVLESATEAFTEITSKERSGDLDPFEQMHQVVLELAKVFQTSVVVQAEFRLIVEPEFYAAMRENAGRVWGATARRLAREAAGLGIMREDVDPDKFTRVLIACLAGQRYMADLLGWETDLPSLFQESLEVVLAAMASPAWLERWQRDGWPQHPGADAE